MAGACLPRVPVSGTAARSRSICREFEFMTQSVLIVEDEKHLADGLRYNLKAEGYEVETVGTAEEALSLLIDAHKTYDVLVLDVMLPGMDGFSLAYKLRSQ